jgi:hypothetical protein
MGLSSPQRRIIQEMSLTTGAVAMPPAALGGSKKRSKKTTPYRADPVTGEPRKGRKKAGKVFKDDIKESADDDPFGLNPKPEVAKIQTYKALLSYYQTSGKTPIPMSSQKDIREIFSIFQGFAKYHAQDSDFYKTAADMTRPASDSHLPKYENMSLARRPVDGALGIRPGFGIYRPTRWSNEDYVKYIGAIWWRAVGAYLEGLRKHLNSIEAGSRIKGRQADLLQKDILAGTKQYMKGSPFPTLMEMYKEVIDEQNALNDPRQKRRKEKDVRQRQARRKFTIPGEPKQYEQESYATVHPGCQTCAQATRFDQSLKDIGLEYDVDQPGFLGRLFGKGPTVRRKFRPEVDDPLEQ